MIQPGDVYRIKYNCYVNCYQIYRVSPERLSADCYKDKISDADMELIRGCIINSPIIPKKELKKFGLIKRT